MDFLLTFRSSEFGVHRCLGSTLVRCLIITVAELLQTVDVLQNTIMNHDVFSAGIGVHRPHSPRGRHSHGRDRGSQLRAAA